MLAVRLFFCLLLFITTRVEAQYATPIKDSIYSNSLGEQRTIEIILPDNYVADTTHYDVWYVPDGEWNTHTFSNIAAYLSAIGFAPRIIIVGVHNRYVNGFNYRDRDLTPTQSSEFDSSGGADHFLAFFEKELMPHIQQKYRTSGECGLFGGSLGGVFTIYALLTRPALFRFYAVSDGAFHYDHQFITRLAAERLPKLTISNRVLNIGGRSGLSYAFMARNVMDSILRISAPKGLHWHSALYDDETHISSTFKSNYDGLKYAYTGYSALQSSSHLTGGIVLKDHPIRLFFPTDHAEIRYTTNGEMPTPSSRRLDEFLLVSDPQQLRVKSFSPSGRYDRLIENNLRSGNYLIAGKLSRNARSAGKLDSIWQSNGSGVMNGYVSIPRDGYYVLQLTPSEGTKLYFNDSLWVAYDPAAGHMRQTIILPLRKGNYALRLEHPSKNQKDPPLNFGFYYSENGQDDWWRNPLVKWVRN